MKHRNILTLLLVLCLALTVVSTAAATETVVATGTVYSSIGTLNVRSGPGTSYAKVGTLYNGDRVELYEIKPTVGYGWGRIDIGWISLEYVELDPEPTDPPHDGYDLVLATGITDTDKEVDALKDPGTDHTIVYTYHPEAVLKFYDFKTAGGIEWGKTDCGGWVNMEYVTLDGEPIDLSTITAKGKNNGIAWILYTDGTLAFTGDCTSNQVGVSRPSPWEKYADQIRTIRFETGSVSYFSNSSLQNLPNLETVYVGSCPASVQALFSGCTNFAAYKTLDDEHSRYAALDGLLLDKTNPNMLVSCPTGIKGVLELPDSITCIGDNAFVCCDQLEEVILPDGLDTVAGYAFGSCTSLKTITFPASTRWLDEDIFIYCTNLETIYFEGDAPSCAVTGDSPFGDYVDARDPKDTRITATAYYPADNPTWTRDAMTALGGNITWVPVGEGELPAFRDGVIAVGKINSTYSVNVRLGPGTAYEKVGVMNNNEEVEIYEYTTVSGTKWARIDNGWISMDYVMLDLNQPEPVATVASGNMNGHLLWWKFTADGKLFITGRSGVGGSSIDPSYYPWYKYRDRITDVIFFGNTPEVPVCAFSAYPVVSDEYPNLKRVTLCESMETIESGAFAGCTGLESIHIPGNIMQIKEAAFYGCANLKEVVLAPGSILETIGAYAFSGTAIRTLALPETARTIDEGAFKGCADLATLTLRDGITAIGHYAFQDCPSLTGELYLSETIETLYGTSFDQMPGFTRVTLNTPMATSMNFRGSQVLESVAFGGTLTNTGSSTFENCTALTEVVFNGPMKKIDSYTFAGCTALKEITLPDTLETIYASAFKGSGLTAIVIPDSVTRMDGNVFEGCSALEKAVVGSGITDLENKMFKDCTSLKTVKLANVQTLTAYCFSGCTALESIDLPDSLELIGTETFRDCTALTSLEIPAAVRNIHNRAFVGSTALMEITFTGDAPAFAFDAFTGITATAYYPGDNATWTEDVMLDYGGNITWQSTENEPDVSTGTPGDTNGDGRVNAMDLILLRQHLAGWDVTINPAGADANGDGRVNAMDLILLRQHLAGWDVTLGG